MKQEDILRAIRLAELLLEHVRPVKGDAKGRVTTTRLRNMFALAMANDPYEAFRLKLLYLVKRNTHDQVKELERFGKDFLKHIEKESDNRMRFAQCTLEYAIMVYAKKEVEVSG